MATPMPASDTLQHYDHYIDGERVAPSSGEYFESLNPFTAKPWAMVARGNDEDVNRAVEAADRAFNSGEWPAMHASARGALLRRLGDLIARDAERLAEIEVRDNGKLIGEMAGQLRYMPNWYYYYGGLADKIEGSVIPIDKPGVQLHQARAAGRSRGDQRLELAAAARDLEAGACARRRQHGSPQAFGVHIGLGTGVHGAGR